MSAEFAPGYEFITKDTKRDKHAPFFADVPNVGPSAAVECTQTLLVSIPHADGTSSPSILLLDRQPAGPAIGMYYTLDARFARAMAGQLIAIANMLDGGAGKQ